MLTITSIIVLRSPFHPFLADDLMSYHGEIYNPFTPVVSPTTEAAATRIDKMYIQTASGYRPVDNTYSYHKSRALIGGDPESNRYVIGAIVNSGKT